MRTNQIRMKYMKLKNVKIKLNEKIQNMKQKNIYDFQKYETIKSFGDNIYTGKISIYEAEMDQSNILENVV